MGFKYGGFSCFYRCSFGLEWIAVFVLGALDVLLLVVYLIGVAEAPRAVGELEYSSCSCHSVLLNSM